jgi:hypothetical protein
MGMGERGSVCINYMLVIIYNNRVPPGFVYDYFIGKAQNGNGFKG